MKLNKAPSSIWRNPWQFIAFGFGVGAIPIIPGTFGTLVGVPFYYLLNLTPLWCYISVTVLLFIGACILCDICSKQIGVHDHGGMVIDEIVGYLFTMIAVPATWYWMLLGFILFRFFDMLKPWPISYCDKNISGGFGVMFDDLVAALFSWIILQLIIYFM